MMSSAAPAPTASAGLLQLQSVFAALDSISPSLPATQSITLPKLKEALSIYAHWSFPDDDHPNPPTPSTPSTLPPTDTFDAQRRRRREEREGWVRDVVDAVDLNRNGRIEFHELIKAVESAKEEKDRRWGVAAQESQADGDGADDEWQPTREVCAHPGVGGVCRPKSHSVAHTAVRCDDCTVVERARRVQCSGWGQGWVSCSSAHHPQPPPRPLCI